jgi:hypothetical protein
MCDAEVDLNGAENKGNCKWELQCPLCGGIRSIDDINTYLVKRGEMIIYDNKVGMIDGNDSNDTDIFSNINYYVCPAEFMGETVWSNHYAMLRRNEFEIRKIKPEFKISSSSICNEKKKYK